MILKEAYIENFGKLHNQKITFQPGINVICGGNEAGKSTMQEFLTAMLFGMEPKRGRNKKKDAYRRYEPWNAASYYCGSLRFEIEDRPFLLKRNFYHKEKTAELRNEADGEQLSVEFGDLSMLLGDLGRSAYENTWCIGQTGAVTGSELAEILQEYLSNVENTGEADISLLLAQKNLEQRGGEIRREKKALFEEKESRIEKLRVEEQILTGDMEKLEEQTGQEAVRHDLKIQSLMREENETAQEPEGGWQVWAAALCGAAAVLNLLLAGRYPVAAWAVVESLFLFFTFFTFFSSRRRVKDRHHRKQTEVQERQKAEIQRHQALEQTFAEQMADKELRRDNVREAIREAMQKSSAEAEVEKKEQALLLAQQILGESSGSMSEEAKEKICASASQILSELTGGRYVSLKFDDAMQIVLSDLKREIPVDALSRGTIEQVYLAVRIAVGKVLSEEPLFYSFDEAFAFYDEDRLAAALAYLAAQPQQSLIFTCTTREEDILKKNDISYHRIVLHTGGGS